MTPKEAVAAARAYFVEVFSEQASLEEIWFDDHMDEWCVTLGVRPRLVRERAPSIVDAIGGGTVREIRDYKVVRIKDKTGEVDSVKLREGGRAA